jgi:hypothetical protein
MMRGITSRDYPVINGCVLLVSTFICLMNLVTDLAYGFIDPRIKAQYTTERPRKLKKRLKRQKKQGDSRMILMTRKQKDKYIQAIETIGTQTSQWGEVFSRLSETGCRSSALYLSC